MEALSWLSKATLDIIGLAGGLSLLSLSSDLNRIEYLTVDA